MILSTLAVLVFPLLMALAASSDLLTMRISNVLVGTLVVAFFVIAVAAGLPLADVGVNALVGLGVLAVGFTFFAFGWIGGGDAKLAAATTMWVGLGSILPYLIYAALLGGALTLALLALRRWPLPEALATVQWIDRLHDTKTGVPYGIALALAGILVYADTPIFRVLVA